LQENGTRCLAKGRLKTFAGRLETSYKTSRDVLEISHGEEF